MTHQHLSQKLQYSSKNLSKQYPCGRHRHSVNSTFEKLSNPFQVFNVFWHLNVSRLHFKLFL